MQIHELNVRKGKHAQRIGRGGKRGTTSGRGQKGQKSRSGHKIRPALRDLIMRIPKHRGFRNKSLASKPCVINLSDLARLKVKSQGAMTVDKQSLVAMGLIPKSYHGAVKLLGTGSVTFPLVVRGIKTSEATKAKIEKAGGRVE
jgi:large subunit ribosomal protein L15